MSPVRLPRVLLVGPMPPTKGGVTTFMLNLMGSELRREFAFLPFTTSRPPKKNVTENWGYRAMLRGGAWRMLTGAAITLWHVCAFPFAVVGQRIDLVQIQASDYQVFWEAAVYAGMARLLRRPVLFRIGGAFDIFHGGASKAEQQLIRCVLRLPHVVIAQSGFAHVYIRAAGRTGTFLILPNWSGTPVEDAPLRSGTATPTCLFIAGQEARRKGIEEVLAAAAALKAAGCAVRFHMLALSPDMMARIAASDIADIMDLEGPATHARVLALMRQCDIFLLPSHGEGFPNALVEAMAAGMACVATPVGAVPEMADHGGAMLVPVADSAALARAIAALAASRTLRKEAGSRARSTVEARYVEAAALPALARTYRNLLSFRKQRPLRDADEGRQRLCP